MIDSALKMQRSLSLLSEANKDLKKYKLLVSEWILLSTIFEFLSYFEELTEILSWEKYVTLPLTIIGFNLLLDQITLFIDNLRSKPDEGLIWTDNAILLGLEACLAKLIKHYQKSYWIYGAILLLDLRHKLEAFNNTSWGKEMKKDCLQKFESVFKTQYYKPKVIYQ